MNWYHDKWNIKTNQIDSYELKWLGDMNLELVDFESFATGFL